MEPILLVEDKAELRAMLRKALERAGYTVEEAPDGNSAIEKVRSGRYLLVLSDLKLPGNSGMDVLREARRVEATLPVILVTAYGSVEEAVTAMKEGAFDFIQKPVDLDHLKLLLERAAQAAGIAARKFAAARGIRGALRLSAHRGRASRDERCQPDDPARGGDRFHGVAAGRKRHGQGAFRARDSSLEPARGASLRGAELRGDSRRAWWKTSFSATSAAPTPGAGARKIGKLELAHRGTLFLDEIGELPLAIQSKLLRVLEEKRFERVGGTQEIEVNVRILTATNKDLRAAVADKTFREDLYFRISAVPITIPPLRERGDDVLLLAEHFLERFRREFRKPDLELTEDARARLLTYSWPGNVRELQNAIERAAILANGPEIDARRAAIARSEADRRGIARRHAGRTIFVGRAARGSLATRRHARGAIQNSKRAARSQVEQNPRRRKARRLLQNPAEQNPRPRPGKLVRCRRSGIVCQLRALPHDRLRTASAAPHCRNSRNNAHDR